MIDGMRESFFVAALSVGCGGFVGSVFRYCLSLIQVRWEFPMMTFVTNILGAVLIGMIAQAALVFISMPPNFLLFMKTGVCGGFTTFSTFEYSLLCGWGSVGKMDRDESILLSVKRNLKIFMQS